MTGNLFLLTVSTDHDRGVINDSPFIYLLTEKTLLECQKWTITFSCLDWLEK